MSITQARVKELFSYNKKTGLLIRRFSRGKAKAGTSSTCKDRDGYIVVGIDGKNCRAHRIIWLYVTGSFPPADIDHINRVRDDNRWHNLRAVTRSENKQNQTAQKNNRSGVKGVHPYRHYLGDYTGQWIAAINHLGAHYYIGIFWDIEEAKAAYAAKAAELHKFNPVSAKA